MADVEYSLHFACRTGNIEEMELIFNIPHVYTYTRLDVGKCAELAIEHKQEGSLRYLIKRVRGNPKVLWSWIYTFAIKPGALWALKILLENEDVRTHANTRHLTDVVDPAVMETIRSATGCDLAAVGDGTLLRIAAYNGNVPMMEYLLTRGGFDCDENRSRAVIHAANSNNPAAMELLLKDGRFSATSNDNQALDTAVMKNRQDMVELLLRDGGADPSVHDHKMIYHAARIPNVAILQQLMLHHKTVPSKIDIERLLNAAGDHLETLEFIAAWREDLDL